MKLSAKLFTVLAALALLAVAIVGTSQATQAADTDGTVYLTNKWSLLTTNSAGFADGGTILADETYVGSGKTLYATFIEKTSAGTSTQSIETNSNVVIVSVVDADKNLPIDATSTTVTTMTDVGNTQVIPVAQADSPIVDADADGDVDTDDITLTHNGSATTTMAVSAVVPGSATTPGIVSVVVTSTTSDATTISLAWKTSAVDTLSATVKSTQDATGIAVTLTETASGTGIFRGEVTLIDAEVDGAVSTTTGGNSLVILNNGTVTASYIDDTPASGGVDVTVSATGVAETNAPQVTVIGPADAAATQDRTPTFSGSVTDSGSGLMLESSVLLFIDDGDDATNITAVDVTVASSDSNTPDVPTTAADGDASVSWDFTPGTALPTGFVTGTVDHLVDWQVRANDLAGNIGFSDADGDAADNLCPIASSPCAVPGDQVGEGSVPGRGEPHLVQIDQKIPSISEAYTGHYWESTAATPIRTADRAT
ncbi:MAG: hypothetical protein HQ548_02340, partial [Chloroflexi bacterium]|nr:hypothetical protein [Chloroflexota bacterium]